MPPSVKKWVEFEDREWNFIIETPTWLALTPQQQENDTMLMFGGIPGCDENNPIRVQLPGPESDLTVGDVIAQCIEHSMKHGVVTGHVVKLPADADIFDILVHAKVFESKSQARKNWEGDSKIQDGLSDFKASKGHVWIAIYKPREETEAEKAFWDAQEKK